MTETKVLDGTSTNLERELEFAMYLLDYFTGRFAYQQLQ